MNVSAIELVAEYGGKLQFCEQITVNSLEALTNRPDRQEHQQLAQESVQAMQRLRTRFNVILQAHGEALDPLLSGRSSFEDEGEMIQLNAEQTWVLDHIEDTYQRLASHTTKR